MAITLSKEDSYRFDGDTEVIAETDGSRTERSYSNPRLNPRLNEKGEIVGYDGIQITRHTRSWVPVPGQPLTRKLEVKQAETLVLRSK